MRVGNAASQAVPARCVRRGDGHLAPGARQRPRSRSPRPGICRWRCSSSSNPTGSFPTTASGRCAARSGTSRTRKSWHGWPSIASSRMPSATASRRRSSAGSGARDAIHAEVCEKGFDAKRGAFVQSYESQSLGCEPAADSASGLSAARRCRACAAPFRRSSASCIVEGFVLRYSTATGVDALPAGEGAFLPARSGWRIAMRSPGAARRPRRCSSGCSRCATMWVCSPEEYDPRAERMLGNFPQALTHMALVNTARLAVDAGAEAQSAAERVSGRRRLPRMRPAGRLAAARIALIIVRKDSVLARGAAAFRRGRWIPLVFGPAAISVSRQFEFSPTG